MLVYFLAFLASCANAAASVLQRKANKQIPREEQMSLRLIWDLLHNPFWFGGIAAVTAGFLLQAAALGNGALAVVEPILVLELPITVVAAWRFFNGELGRREWSAVAAMTVGLIGLIYFLSPTGGQSSGVPLWEWLVGLLAAAIVLAVLVFIGWRVRNDMGRAAIYGCATGLGFGVTAALIKGMTVAASSGFTHVFTAWQTYAMIVTGALSMYLLQNAVNAGRLVAAQPGITLTDPIVSILWGVLIFGERVRQGLYLVLAVGGLAMIAAAVVVLAKSPLLKEDDEAHEGEAGYDGENSPAYGDGAADDEPDRDQAGATDTPAASADRTS